MKTIIVINDGSTVSKHAAELALEIAVKTNAHLLLANTVAKSSSNIIREPVLMLVGEGIENHADIGLAEYLESLNHPNQSHLKANITETDISEYHEKELIQLIMRTDTWLIIKGFSRTPDININATPINIGAVLNRVNCPLLIVPDKYSVKDFERIVYITDLRYCRLGVVRFLAQFAEYYQASAMVAHISAKGLTPLDEHYAHELFNEVVNRNVHDKPFIFNNIKDKNSQIALDIMINDMQTDLVALVNHRFHFEEIIGRYISDILPEHVTVPMIVFPC